MTSEYTYFIWIGKGWEIGDPLDIQKHFIGSYKNYKDASTKLKELAEEHGATEEIVCGFETTSSICKCCGEIEAYDVDRTQNGYQISLYRCRPH